jgi:hypothetical protein
MENKAINKTNKLHSGVIKTIHFKKTNQPKSADARTLPSFSR